MAALKYVENEETISAWATEAFGPSTRLATAQRALLEIDELITILEKNMQSMRGVGEAADVAIVLVRIPHYDGDQILSDVLPYSGGYTSPVFRYGLERVKRARTILVSLIDNLERDENYAGATGAAKQIVMIMHHFVNALGCDLREAIDFKMGINRKRKWRPAGDGTGFHTHEPDGHE